jgi:hypothetical protein
MARRRIGDAPLTAAERQRRRRERLAANRDTERSHEIPLAAEVARLNAELAEAAERMKRRDEELWLVRAVRDEQAAELAKMKRSRDYWQRRVRDDERRAILEDEEPLWKKMEAGSEKRDGRANWGDKDFNAFLTQQYEAMRQNACEQYNLQPKMPLELWRRLAQLVHPDKHGGSEAAQAATVWLNQHKPPATTI